VKPKVPEDAADGTVARGTQALLNELREKVPDAIILGAVRVRRGAPGNVKKGNAVAAQRVYLRLFVKPLLL
jgi:hypothetical protein